MNREEINLIYDKYRKLKFDFHNIKIAIFNIDEIEEECVGKKDIAFWVNIPVERIQHGIKYNRRCIFISFKKFQEMKLTRLEKRAIIFHEIGHVLHLEKDLESYYYLSYMKEEIKTNYEFYHLEKEGIADAIAAQFVGIKAVANASQKTSISVLKDFLNKFKEREINFGDCLRIETELRMRRVRDENLYTRKYFAIASDLLKM